MKNIQQFSQCPTIMQWILFDCRDKYVLPHATLIERDSVRDVDLHKE